MLHCHHIYMYFCMCQVSHIFFSDSKVLTSQRKYWLNRYRHHKEIAFPGNIRNFSTLPQNFHTHLTSDIHQLCLSAAQTQKNAAITAQTNAQNNQGEICYSLTSFYFILLLSLIHHEKSRLTVSFSDKQRLRNCTHHHSQVWTRKCASFSNRLAEHASASLLGLISWICMTMGLVTYAPRLWQ